MAVESYEQFNTISINIMETSNGVLVLVKLHAWKPLFRGISIPIK